MTKPQLGDDREEAARGRGSGRPHGFRTMSSFHQGIEDSPQLGLNGFVSETTHSTPRKPSLPDPVPRSGESLRPPKQAAHQHPGDDRGAQRCLADPKPTKIPLHFYAFLRWGRALGGGGLTHTRDGFGITEGSIQGSNSSLPTNFIETSVQRGRGRAGRRRTGEGRGKLKPAVPR